MSQTWRIVTTVLIVAVIVAEVISGPGGATYIFGMFIMEWKASIIRPSATLPASSPLFAEARRLYPEQPPTDR